MMTSEKLFYAETKLIDQIDNVHEIERQRAEKHQPWGAGHADFESQVRTLVADFLEHATAYREEKANLTALDLQAGLYSEWRTFMGGAPPTMAVLEAFNRARARLNEITATPIQPELKPDEGGQRNELKKHRRAIVDKFQKDRGMPNRKAVAKHLGCSVETLQAIIRGTEDRYADDTLLRVLGLLGCERKDWDSAPELRITPHSLRILRTNLTD